MAVPSTHEVTQLLVAWSDSDKYTLEKLVPLVHAELHRLAGHYMAGERPGHQLQTSALVNEAYLRLIDWKNVRWQNRAHFFGVSAQIMRRILVAFARKRPRVAGNTANHVSLEVDLNVTENRGDDLVALDEAITELAQIDERKSRIVELRFFGGLSVKETAEVIQLSEITVIREWNKARARLYRALKRGDGYRLAGGRRSTVTAAESLGG